MIAIGLMSGTSLDGLDIVLCNINGQKQDTDIEVLAFKACEMPQKLKDAILRVSHPETSRIDELTSLNVEIGMWYADEVAQFLEELNFKEPIDFIASHGQTIYHLPKPKDPKFVNSTLQIGDPSFLAERFNTDVVFNFRMMDIAVGGDGAPLVPYTEYVLYSSSEMTTLLQNIGGIGNVTILEKNGSLDDVSAFDTGPGNMMINAATHYYYQESYDKDGNYARQGQLINDLYQELIEHPYLKVQPPKSTGREMFGEDVTLKICQRYPNQANDVIYTLTKFTAYTIAKSYQKFIFPTLDVDRILVAGGGAYNPVLMAEIKEMLPNHHVMSQEDIGMSSDAKEAIAFVILGNETLHGNHNNAKNATGASRYTLLGQISPKPYRNNL